MPKIVPYDETSERMILAETVLEEPESATDARIRARHACASSRAKFEWMRFDVCTSRRGGTLPASLTKLTDSASAERILRAFIGQAELELFETISVLLLDARNAPLGFVVAGRGGVASSMADMHSIFRAAVLLPAVSIILCHNHPSGEPTPSADDLELTRKVVEMGKLLGVRVLDHLILTRTAALSFLSAGIMPK